MRNCIVTGATRGLGLAIATALAAAGDRVIGIARTQTELFRRAAEAVDEDTGGALIFQPFDLADTREIGALIGVLRRQHGPIYGLVNNAGLGLAGVLANLQLAQIEAMTRVNMIAPIVLTKYVVRSMMLERAGRIVNIASAVAKAGFNGLSVYAASKAALIGFTRSLAREVGSLGITVNAVAPGLADTEMTRSIDAAVREKISRRSALRRIIEPSDVASAVLFLLSDQARNITGVTLTVDAGATA